MRLLTRWMQRRDGRDYGFQAKFWQVPNRSRFDVSQPLVSHHENGISAIRYQCVSSLASTRVRFWVDFVHSKLDAGLRMAEMSKQNGGCFKTGWWLGCHQLIIVPEILGISSSQLTNSYFSEGWPNHQPENLLKTLWVYFIELRVWRTHHLLHFQHCFGSCYSPLIPLYAHVVSYILYVTLFISTWILNFHVYYH